MPGHDVIVVGASAGGVEALQQMARDLPADLPAAVFVVLHVPSYSDSALPLIMSRAGTLPAAHAVYGEWIRPGRIYIAPPDFHMLLHRGFVRLSRGPRENGHRPAVDPLFRSAARAYGPRVIGVVLSGALDDGTAGLAAVRSLGGLTVVQDPEDAMFDGMPRSALEHTEAEEVLPLSEIGAALARLAQTPAVVSEDSSMPDDIEKEIDIDEFDEDAMQQAQRPGTPAGFGCPDCGGALWEIHDGEMVRFRCRVGHAWGVDGLLAAQSDALDEALWTALRALEERAALSERMSARARARGHKLTEQRFSEDAVESRRRAALIRRILLNRGEPSPTPSGENEGNEEAARSASG